MFYTIFSESSMNNKFKKILRCLTDPKWAISVIITHYPRLIKNDELYLKWDFYHGIGRWPELAFEKEEKMSFNEKINWLKIHYRNSLMTKLVDKYEVKEWVKEHCPDVKIIPTIGVWERFDDIDFNELPDKFVLKCTHDSGGLVICKDKSTLDMNAAKKKIERSLKRDFSIRHRELPYKDVPPRIIAEEYMVDESGIQLKDYKYFCFNGEPKMVLIVSDRECGIRDDFFDMNFKHLPFKRGGAWSNNIKKPENFEKMIEYAKQLSREFPFARVDFYNIKGSVYFGEITFFPAAGVVPFDPEEWDYKIGKWLKLPVDYHSDMM